MQQKVYNQKFTFRDAAIRVESNRIARLADQSFLVYWNKSTVLVTICIGKDKSANSWMPLTVDFQDNLYAAGRIPGSFFRREGKPSDFAVLSARMIDRSVRNLFPKNFRTDVQIIVQPLSVDYSTDIRVVGLFAASLALNCSSLPFAQPVAAATVGYINGELVINPTTAQMKTSELEMFVSGTKDKVNMIEISANELPEELIIEGINLAHQAITELLVIENQVIDAFPQPKVEHFVDEIPTTVADWLQKNYQSEIDNLFAQSTNHNRDAAKSQLLKKMITDAAATEQEFAPSAINAWLESALSNYVRTQIVKHQKRIDGRKMDEIRPLEANVDLLPIVHGSSLFGRGLTQTMSIVTLGPMTDNQLIDDLTPMKTKRFLHHYKSLPFSFGHGAPIRGVSRRETGHGQLGYKALKWVLPTLEDFPYTLRVLSEVMSSNGSTSQASICSASLALMAAGVPIKAHVAGTATGLVHDGKDYHLLTDIQAWEDFYGDMDFKIAGTKKGVCSVQIDLKIEGLPLEVVKNVFLRARGDRMKILEIMAQAIAQPRPTLGEDALKFAKFQVQQSDISGIIGPSGKNIKKIIAEADNAAINIEDDGTVLVYHKNQSMIDKAKKMVMTPPARPERPGRDGSRRFTGKLPKIGDKLKGTVINIVEYGAFIELDGTKINGLLHISELNGNEFVKDINKVLEMNQRLLVEVIKINDRKQIGLKLLKKI